jgi:hypothetical protein
MAYNYKHHGPRTGTPRLIELDIDAKRKLTAEVQRRSPGVPSPRLRQGRRMGCSQIRVGRTDVEPTEGAGHGFDEGDPTPERPNAHCDVPSVSRTVGQAFGTIATAAALSWAVQTTHDLIQLLDYARGPANDGASAKVGKRLNNHCASPPQQDLSLSPTISPSSGGAHAWHVRLALGHPPSPPGASPSYVASIADAGEAHTRTRKAAAEAAGRETRRRRGSSFVSPPAG